MRHYSVKFVLLGFYEFEILESL